jgi:hypothetical protein
MRSRYRSVDLGVVSTVGDSGRFAEPSLQQDRPGRMEVIERMPFSIEGSGASGVLSEPGHLASPVHPDRQLVDPAPSERFYGTV